MTRWSSAYNDGEWLSVDLGNQAFICEVELLWEAAYASSYEVQISGDGTNWNTLHINSASDGGSDKIEITAAQARYLRVVGTTRATEWGISLWELTVKGTYGGLPVAVITAPNNIGEVGTAAVFSAERSFDDAGELIAFDWVIRPPSGPEWSGSGATVSYTPSVAGNYEITLTVTDNDGNQATVSETFSAAQPNSSGNPICARAFFCEGFENGFGKGTQSGNPQHSNIDSTQGANNSRRSFHYSTAQGQGDAWVAFTNTAMKNADEVWISYYQKISKTPVPTNWFALIGPASSDYPAFRLGTQKYGEAAGQNGVLGNWSCWGGNPCPSGSVGYDSSLDPAGGRGTLPLNQWVCIEIKITGGKNFSVYLTPSVKSGVADGAIYISDRTHPFTPTPIERVRLGYNPQSDSLEGWVDDVIIASERPGCQR